MAETELERAEKRFAQAKARLLALKNREATKARKLDTRRKIILGGALMDLAARDESAARMLERLVRNLPREQDRKMFAAESGESDGSGAPAPGNGSRETGSGGMSNTATGLSIDEALDRTRPGSGTTPATGAAGDR